MTPLRTAQTGRIGRVHLAVTTDDGLVPLCCVTRQTRQPGTPVYATAITCQSCIAARPIWGHVVTEVWRRAHAPETAPVVPADVARTRLYQALMREV